MTDPKPTKKILLLSGGNLVGQNVLASLEGRRQELYLIATNSIANEPVLFSYDKVYLTQVLTRHRSEFESQFLKILQAEQPDLVIPCRDEDVYFLAEFGERYPALSNKLLCGNAVMANCMVDKQMSASLCNELEIPFAETIMASEDQKNLDEFFRRFSFPVIAKPVRGFASQGVYLILNKLQADTFMGNEEYIFQRYIGPTKQITQYLETVERNGLPLFHSFEQEKVSVQGLITPAGGVAGSMVTIHQMTGGKSNHVSISHREDWNNQSKAWIHKMAEKGWVGPINIQCQEEEKGNLIAYELNGRFTGATHARSFFGFDEVGLTLQHWCNIDPGSHYWNDTTQAVRKVSINVALDDEKCKILADNKEWSNKI